MKNYASYLEYICVFVSMCFLYFPIRVVVPVIVLELRNYSWSLPHTPPPLPLPIIHLNMDSVDGLYHAHLSFCFNRLSRLHGRLATIYIEMDNTDSIDNWDRLRAEVDTICQNIVMMKKKNPGTKGYPSVFLWVVCLILCGFHFTVGTVSYWTPSCTVSILMMPRLETG